MLLLSMFTGIIESVARIVENTGHRLVLERPAMFDDVKLGSSIAVAGVCLSIVELSDTSIRFDVVDETLSKTTLDSLKVGDTVNLERAMLSGSRLDGHIVQGHVENVGVVVGVSSIPQPLPPEEEGERPTKEVGERLTREEGKRPMEEEGEPKRNHFSSVIRGFMRTMRKNPTDAEAMLWHVLRHDQLGVRFRRQYHVAGRILDFYCPALKLCIEVDGGIHRSLVAKKEDEGRDVFLLEYGVRTLRFTNEEVLENLPGVLVQIDTLVRTSPPPSEEGRGVEEHNTQNKTVSIRIPRPLLAFIFPKGSISLDGVSLTVADIQGDLCTVALIPHTLANTTLKNLQEGDRVNVETDILSRGGLRNLR